MGGRCYACNRRNLAKFFCTNCLSERHNSHHTTLDKVGGLRDGVRERASKLLDDGGVREERNLRAEKWKRESKLAKALQETAKLRQEKKKSSERIAHLQSSLERRRQNLSLARLHLSHISMPASSNASSGITSTNPFLSQPATPSISPSPSTSASPLASTSLTPTLRSASHESKLFSRRWDELSEEISKTRRVLVRELIEVFEVSEVEGTGGREWTIAGNRLGLIGDLRRIRDSQSVIRINTALWHLAHLTRLLAMYLAIKLPFNPDLAAFGPGRPGMTTSSLEGGWSTKYAARYPLYISTSSIDPSSSSPSATSSTPIRPSPHSTEALLTSLSMLSYSISYLAYTQGAHVSQLSASGGENMLSILYHAVRWEEGEEERVGTKSHGTGRRKLGVPSVVGRERERDKEGNGLGMIGMEEREGEGWDVQFERVLQIVCAKEGEHRRSRSEGGSRTGGGYGFIKRREGSQRERRAESVKEEEEEGGWSLV